MRRVLAVLVAVLAFALMTYAMKYLLWFLLPGWMVVLADSLIELKSTQRWNSAKGMVTSALLLVVTGAGMYVHILVELDPELALGMLWVFYMNLFAAGVAVVRLLADDPSSEPT